MLFRVAIFVVLSIGVVVECVPARRSCVVDSNCGQNQCCTDPDAPLIMNKRDASVLFSAPTGGVCMDYAPAGADCGRLFWQGDRVCGCSPGYVCTFIPEVANRKRTLSGPLIGPSPPGNYVCALQVEQ